MQNNGKTNRRSMKRFNLELPVQISVFEKKQAAKKLLGMSVRDISGNGVFLNSVQLLSKGKTLKIAFNLPMSFLDKIINETIDLNIKGKVVRTEKMGFAVKFMGSYQLNL